MAMNAVVSDVPSLEELMKSPLAKFITLSASNCGYSGSAKDLIADFIHSLFLKANTSPSKKDNPNW